MEKKPKIENQKQPQNDHQQPSTSAATGISPPPALLAEETETTRNIGQKQNGRNNSSNINLEGRIGQVK
jgi:hypothetical protein